VGASVVDLRELFARPWAGSAQLWRPRWLRWLPAPDRFDFRSEIADVTEEGWEVIDTSTFVNGRVEVRRMRCTVLADGRMRLDADDMPGGAIVTPRDDGFDFTPYRIRTPVLGPLRVTLRFTDRVRLTPDATMLDEIELRYLGLLVGRITMRLAPVPA
jgi:hypothetical protein